MSKMTAWPALVGIVAGAIAVAAYDKASTLSAQLQAIKAPVADPARDQLQSDVHRLEARVALLEKSARSVAPGSPAALPSLAAAPVPRPIDVGPAPTDPAQREQRKERVGVFVDAYWKEWSGQHGLSPSQAEALSAMQVDAAKRRLDNQARLADRTITQVDGKADNAAAVQEVRQKARALLTVEQFAQFEAEKGAELGSSYRRLREAWSKAAPPPDAPPK